MAGFSGATGVPLKQMQDAIAQSTAWSNNWLTNTSILAYAASVANPSFTTFRTSSTSTDVPIANEYYIGTVERYGQNITVKMTTMQDASKMYINNSVNGGSTWTGWKTFMDSQSTVLGGKQVQWGHLSLPSIAASGQTEITVTLPKSYNGGNDYMAVVTPIAYAAASYINYVIRNKSSGSFVVRIYNSSTSVINDTYLDWITIGV